MLTLYREPVQAQPVQPLNRWRQVRPFLEDSRRIHRYRTLLRDFGIRPDLAEEARPRPFTARPPGNWFHVNDARRIALTQTLAGRLETNPWVGQTQTDPFRIDGLHQSLSRWRLHRGGAWSWLVSRWHRGAWQHRGHGSIVLDKPTEERLRRHFHLALEIIDRAPAPRRLWSLLDRRQPDDLRRLLGPPRSRTHATAWGAELERHDLEAARIPLKADPEHARTALNRSMDHLHRAVIGHPFPWISLPGGHATSSRGSFLDPFDADTYHRTRRCLEDFFR